MPNKPEELAAANAATTGQNDVESDKIEWYLAFLRYALDNQSPYPDFLEKIDWDGLMDFGQRQSILGVLYYGLNRIPANVPNRPHRKKVAEWVGIYNELVKRNEEVNKDAARITYFFYKKYGVKSCILKGQANTAYYPDPFMRTPGDIDLWTDQDELSIMRIAYSLNKETIDKIDYHHVELPGLLKTVLEVHFKPSFMVNLWYQKRLDRFFDEVKKQQFRNFHTLPNGRTICVGTHEFNRVFQLTHLEHHFLTEGVGFRQVIDYYYLLRQGFTPEEREASMKIIDHLHMHKFAAGLMWVLHHVLGLDEKYLLTEPNEKVGKLMRDEILKGGNFGHYDERYDFHGKKRWGAFFLETWRNLHFVFHFPAETIWGRPLAYFAFAKHKKELRRQLEKSLIEQPLSTE